jgi:tripartite-type tricarboxylate transporter receptor subunit TctC
LKEKFAAMSIEPVNSTPEEFAKVIREESVIWAKVVKAAGIKPQ